MTIRTNVDFDEWQADWLAACRKQGHTLVEHKLGHVDLFAYTHGRYHNGPKCAVCGWGECMHCDAAAEWIPPCRGPAL